jgi:hypothetical protein
MWCMSHATLNSQQLARCCKGPWSISLQSHSWQSQSAVTLQMCHRASASVLTLLHVLPVASGKRKLCMVECSLPLYPLSLSPHLLIPS